MSRKAKLLDLLAYGELKKQDDELVKKMGSDFAIQERDRVWAKNFKTFRTDEIPTKWVEWRRASESLQSDRLSGILTALLWGGKGCACVLGISLGSALLMYDGSEPVNVLPWILLTGLIPLLTSVVLTVCSLLDIKGFLEGPAEVMFNVVSRVTRLDRQAFDPVTRDLLKKSVLIEFHSLTWIYAAGAALALLVQVLISDRVFSWATTLDVSPNFVYHYFKTLAWPWSWFWAEAVPDMAAVEQAQYMRYHQNFEGDVARGVVDSSISQRWWIFCFLITLFYGILPRYFFVAGSSLRLARAYRMWSCSHIHAELLRRCRSTEGSFHKLERPKEKGEPDVKPTSESGLIEDVSAIKEPEQEIQNIAWGEVGSRDDLWSNLSDQPWQKAGVDLDIEVDQATLRSLSLSEAKIDIYIDDREPPVEDILVFLRELRVMGKEPNLRFVSYSESGWALCRTSPEAWLPVLERPLMEGGLR